MQQTIWDEVCSDLRRTIGKDEFQNWIAPIGFVEIDNGTVRLNAPTSFMGTWVNRNFGDRILAGFRRLEPDARRLFFDVAAARRARETAAAAEAALDTPAELTPQSPRPRPAAPLSLVADGELPGAPLDPRYRFDTFVVGKPNELAHAAARRVADGGPVTFNPLFLHGGVGLGKTHLMHAIGWEIRERNPDAKVLYLSAEQFMYRFVQALRFKEMTNFKALFRSVDVLMVDDVQFITGKESTQEEFFHTFNALVDQGRQIVISGDRSPGELGGLDERIRSRLQWGLEVDIHPTDYELRLGIMQSKAEAQSAHYPDVLIEKGVLEFLAHRISSNVRVLEGALNRLYANADLFTKRIDFDVVHGCLADLLRASERKVTIEEIGRCVAEYYAIKMTELLSARRARSVARPRQMAMYLAKMLTSKSLPEIGRKMGGRDHTTVIHAVRKIEELRQIDAQINDDIEILRRRLES